MRWIKGKREKKRTEIPKSLLYLLSRCTGSSASFSALCFPIISSDLSSVGEKASTCWFVCFSRRKAGKGASDMSNSVIWKYLHPETVLLFHSFCKAQKAFWLYTRHVQCLHYCNNPSGTKSSLNYTVISLCWNQGEEVQVCCCCLSLILRALVRASSNLKMYSSSTAPQLQHTANTAS